MTTEIAITVRRGSSPQSEYRYSGGETVTVGRLDDCGIVLREMTVSRYHCVLEIAPPEISVRELGSRNGTWILRGGEELALEKDRVTRLADGDSLMVGRDCLLGIALPERGKGRVCEMCGAVFSGGEAQADICPECMKNEMAVMHFLLNQVDPGGEGGGRSPAGYDEIRRLGGGTTGEVWLVENRASRQQAACKRLRSSLTASGQVRERFLREIAVGSRLEHPNIVRQYGCGEDENGLYILMEYCAGGNLSDYIRRRGSRQGGRLCPAEATAIMLQALDGLIYLHGAQLESTLVTGETRLVRGVVHRDIKPGNIFAADGGEAPLVKLADFGFSKAFETAGLTRYTLTGERGGSWDYTPRAQINDYRRAGPFADVWALTATYYELLTGFPPKQTRGAANAVAVALTTDALPILSRNPELPRPLAELVDYVLWEPPPGGRPHVETAMKLKQLLQEAL